ncbi:hypothetical protein [Acanthopleuribacter pedis]|uniref:Uncharacterized protein n=1 Tax=Acanthopleuribacter pedis TaxID=442870 RepID=A0A8J7U5S3_9BACT|nr:hypothetical protein [Acanthopleuribacter pedis]MBO1319611.1 hypothetical protein [Acanthopleuribacter pedis]
MNNIAQPNPTPKRRRPLGQILVFLLFLSVWGLWLSNETGKRANTDTAPGSEPTVTSFLLFLDPAAEAAGFRLEQVTGIVTGHGQHRTLELTGLVRNQSKKAARTLIFTIQFYDRFDQAVIQRTLPFWDVPAAAMQPGDPATFHLQRRLDPFVTYGRLQLTDLLTEPIPPKTEHQTRRLAVKQHLAFDLRAATPLTEGPPRTLVSLAVTNHADKAVQAASLTLSGLGRQGRTRAQKTLTLTTANLPSVLAGDHRLLHAVLHHEEPIADWHIEVVSLAYVPTGQTE